MTFHDFCCCCWFHGLWLVYMVLPGFCFVLAVPNTTKVLNAVSSNPNWAWKAGGEMLRKLQIIPLPKLYLGPKISSRPSDDEDDSASSSKAPPRSASPGSLSQTHTLPRKDAHNKIFLHQLVLSRMLICWSQPPCIHLAEQLYLSLFVVLLPPHNARTMTIRNQLLKIIGCLKAYD